MTYDEKLVEYKRLADEHFRSVARLSMRPIIAGGLNPVTRIAEQVLLSYLPAGSITIVAYGYRLISAVGGTIFFRSVMVTLLPRLTAAESRPAELANLARQGLRIMLALSLPLTAFIAVLATPGALVVFQRGRFTRADALLLGAVITLYSASLVGSGVQRALLAPFFALLDTRTPLRNTIYGVLANLVFLPVAVAGIAVAGRPAVLGVAVAYSAAQYVNGYVTDTVSLDRLTVNGGIRVDHQTSSLSAASVPGSSLQAHIFGERRAGRAS